MCGVRNLATLPVPQFNLVRVPSLFARSNPAEILSCVPRNALTGKVPSRCYCFSHLMTSMILSRQTRPWVSASEMRGMRGVID